MSLFERANAEEFKDEIVNEEFKDREDVTKDEKREFAFELDINFPNDFSVFLYLINNVDGLKIKMESFLYLLFPNIKRVLIDIKDIKLMDRDEETYIISNSSFVSIKEVVLNILNYKTQEEKSQEFNPVNEAAREIAEKIEKARKARASNQPLNNSESPLSDMSSMLATSGNLSIREVMEMTYPQVVIQYERSVMLLGFVNQIRASAFGGLNPDDIIDWTIPL